MLENNSEQYRVAEKIKELFKAQFEILINIDKEEHFIGSIFPDIIFLDIKTKTPLFAIEVKKNGSVSSCMHQWKAQPKVPVTLYVIVPEAELQSAKSIAAITGLNSRFGYYTLDAEGKVLNVIFE